MSVFPCVHPGCVAFAREGVGTCKGHDPITLSRLAEVRHRAIVMAEACVLSRAQKLAVRDGQPGSFERDARALRDVLGTYFKVITK